MTPAELHANHHRLITERVVKAHAARDKKRAGGDAASTIAGHLRSMHGWRRQGPPLSITDLQAIHDQKHKEES